MSSILDSSPLATCPLQCAASQLAGWNGQHQCRAHVHMHACVCVLPQNGSKIKRQAMVALPHPHTGSTRETSQRWRSPPVRLSTSRSILHRLEEEAETQLCAQQALLPAASCCGQATAAAAGWFGPHARRSVCPLSLPHLSSESRPSTSPACTQRAGVVISHVHAEQQTHEERGS